jgi:EVE domain
VNLGREQGFMQVCHGKAAPLLRLHGSDRVAYYSPTSAFRGKDTLQAFTALGVVRSGEPYAADMGGGFRPYRRDVNWLAARPAAIRPLLVQLAFASRPGGWGYPMRFGLFEISAHDMDLIAGAMQAACREPASAR